MTFHVAVPPDFAGPLGEGPREEARGVCHWPAAWDDGRGPAPDSKSTLHVVG